MAACPAFDATGPYVGNVLGVVDCQLGALAQDGWQAISAQSGFGAGLTGLLVIFVALIGYRLMLGEQLALRDGALLALRMGLVLALGTQWAAWDALAYRVGTQGSEELASAVLGGTGEDDRYNLAIRLDRIGAQFDAMLALDPGAAPPPATTLSADQKKALASSLSLIQASALAGLIAVRAIIALLLALGPLFIASLLFAATRSLFAGWLRAMGGAIVAGVAVPMVLALELLVVEPQSAALAEIIGSSQPLGAQVSQLGTSALLFALVLLAVALGTARAAWAFRVPDGWSPQARSLAQQRLSAAESAPYRMAEPAPASPQPQRSRAQQLADAAMLAQRRDEAGSHESGPTGLLRQPAMLRNTVGQAPPSAASTITNTATRRGLSRKSAQAFRRDQGS